MSESSTAARQHWAELIEQLESRTLLSAAVHQSHTLATGDADGQYTGDMRLLGAIAAITDGSCDLFDGGKKEGLRALDGFKQYQQQGNTNAQPSPDSAVPQSATTLGHTFVVAIIPQSAGGGTIQIEDAKTCTADGTFAPGNLFYPVSFDFTGTRTTRKVTAVSPVPASTNSAPVMTLKKRNPALGLYKGSLADTVRGTIYNISVQVTNNKAGHPAMHAQIGVGGFGEVDFDVVLHAHSTGSFESIMLGSRPTDGFINGHVTHTGRLVLTLISPGLSVNTGSLKRLVAAAAPLSAAAPTSSALARLFAQHQGDSSLSDLL